MSPLRKAAQRDKRYAGALFGFNPDISDQLDVL
jgi:hypothetical protein